jgi:hypothetical protein
MYRVRMDPVFAMAESYFLDGGSRLDDVQFASLASAVKGDPLPFWIASFPT